MLPNKIAKEHDNKIIVRSYEAAKKSYKLFKINFTKMAKLTMSILCEIPASIELILATDYEYIKFYNYIIRWIYSAYEE